MVDDPNSTLTVDTESQNLCVNSITNASKSIDESRKRSLEEMGQLDLSTEEQKGTGQIIDGTPTKLIKLNSGEASLVPSDSIDKLENDTNVSYEFTNPPNNKIDSNIKLMNPSSTIQLSNPDDSRPGGMEVLINKTSNIGETSSEDKEIKSDPTMNEVTKTSMATKDTAGNNNTNETSEEKVTVDNGFVFSTTTSGVRSDPTVFKGNIYKSNNHKKTTPKTYNKANKTRGYGRFNKSVIRQQIKEGTISIPLVSPETLAEIAKSGVPLPESIEKIQKNIAEIETSVGTPEANSVESGPQEGEVSGDKVDDTTEGQKDIKKESSSTDNENKVDVEKRTNFAEEKDQSDKQKLITPDQNESENKKEIVEDKNDSHLKYSITSDHMILLEKEKKRLEGDLSTPLSKEEEKKLKKEKKKEAKEARAQEKRRKREKMKQLLKESSEISKVSSNERIESETNTNQNLNTEESMLTRVHSYSENKEFVDHSFSTVDNEAPKEEEVKAANDMKENRSILNPSDKIIGLKSEVNSKGVKVDETPSNSSEVENIKKDSDGLTISIGSNPCTNPSPRSIPPPCSTSPYMRGSPYGPPTNSSTGTNTNNFPMMPGTFKNPNFYNPLNVTNNVPSPYHPFANSSTPELMYNKFQPQEAFGLQTNMQGQRQISQQQVQRYPQGPLRQSPYPTPPFPYAPGAPPYPAAHHMYQQSIPPPGQLPYPRQQRQQPVYPPQRK